jgi:hypothetical protein
MFETLAGSDLLLPGSTAILNVILAEGCLSRRTGAEMWRRGQCRQGLRGREAQRTPRSAMMAVSQLSRI